jgi:DNA-binding transcriptional LysR family regulator
VTPEFLEKWGPIIHPGDLSRMPCIIDTNGRFYNNWRFFSPDGSHFNISVNGPIEVNSPISAMRAAISGLGVAMVPDFIGKAHRDAGRLVTVLDDFVPTDRGIYAIYPHRRYLPAKVRAFVDFLHGWFKQNL